MSFNQVNSLCTLFDDLEVTKRHGIIYVGTQISHEGNVDISGVDRYTCAYCLNKFYSRNLLFQHLRYFGVDTTPKPGVKTGFKRFRVSDDSINNNNYIMDKEMTVFDRNLKKRRKDILVLSQS